MALGFLKRGNLGLYDLPSEANVHMELQENFSVMTLVEINCESYSRPMNYGHYRKGC